MTSYGDTWRPTVLEHITSQDITGWRYYATLIDSYGVIRAAMGPLYADEAQRQIESGSMSNCERAVAAGHLDGANADLADDIEHHKDRFQRLR